MLDRAKDGAARQVPLEIGTSFLEQLEAWKQSLMLVNPATVVRWHRAGFRLYWSLISRARRRVGRRKLSKEVRDLIYQMVVRGFGANDLWLDEAGAPRSRASQTWAYVS